MKGREFERGEIVAPSLIALAYSRMSVIAGKMTCKNTGPAFGIDVMAIATLLTKESMQMVLVSMS